MLRPDCAGSLRLNLLRGGLHTTWMLATTVQAEGKLAEAKALLEAQTNTAAGKRPQSNSR